MTPNHMEQDFIFLRGQVQCLSRLTVITVEALT